MKTQIYFIALIPPAEIREEVTQFKKYASRHFKASHALKSPPHITLFPPFRWSAEKEASLREALKNFAAVRSIFQVQLEDFDRFDRRVIFVHVIPNQELLDFQKDLKAYINKQLELTHVDERPYHPHMTVAFKDLKPDVFEQAWAYFSEQAYERVFEADQLYLLKHDGKQWQVIQEELIGSKH